jgi:arylsulfatase A-like enzyme
MKAKINLTAILVFLLIALSGFPLQAKPDLKNVIIISVDTLRADHLGCYGYPLNTSPNIDAFSRDSIRFSHCYALTPLTTPSFSTLLTSLPPHKHGAKRNGLSIYRHVKTLPYYLKRFGYHTAAFISNWPLKKHLARLDQGFDDYVEIFTKKRYMGIINSEGEAPVVTEKTIDWLEKNHKKRFFLWVLYTEPHRPYISHEGFNFDYQGVPPSAYPPGTRMKKIKRYDSEIAYTDYYIGKLLEKIKSLGIYQEALIIFNSDHGESFGEHNYFRHGRRLYNSTVHVPLMIKLPHNWLKNTVRRENISLVDISPSILSVLNIPSPSHMEGISLFKEGSRFLARQILLETYAGTVHLKRNNKKYHLKIKPIRYGIIDGSSKIIYNMKDKTYEAYRVTEDPFESQNIFVRETSTLDPMKKQLENRLQRMSKYIKYNRIYRLNQSSDISKEDFDMLKSLGYIE